jgi:hypothetical protein
MGMPDKGDADERKTTKHLIWVRSDQKQRIIKHLEYRR